MALPSRRKGGRGGTRTDIAIAVDGLRPLTKALRHTEDRLDKHLKDRLKDIADPVRSRAARNAPKRTGRLSRSIKTFATQKGAGVRSTVPYASVQEYGGRVGRNRATRIKGSGFMERAVRSSQRDVERAADQLFQDIADDFGK